MKYVYPACVLFAMAISTACNTGETGNKASTTVSAASADAVIVKQQKLNSSIFSSGNIIANEQVTLKSELAGKVISFHFEEGKPVKQNQLLFKIDDSELLAQLSKVNVQLKLAKTDLDRKKQLYDIQAISLEEYDASANRAAELQAEKDLLNARIDKSSIRAPFSGVAGLRQVSPGAFVTTGDVLTTIIQNNPVKVEFAIPEYYAREVEKGTKIKFTVAGLDDTFSGEVYAFEPRINESSRNLLIRAKAQNKQDKLIPGSFASVTVPLKQIPDALMVPAEAIIPELDGQKVMRVKNGKVTNTPINIGQRNENMVQATGGLASGDTVLVTGLLQLREGMSVTPKITGKP